MLLEIGLHPANNKVPQGMCTVCMDPWLGHEQTGTSTSHWMRAFCFTGFRLVLQCLAGSASVLSYHAVLQCLLLEHGYTWADTHAICLCSVWEHLDINKLSWLLGHGWVVMAAWGSNPVPVPWSWLAVVASGKQRPNPCVAWWELHFLSSLKCLPLALIYQAVWYNE